MTEKFSQNEKARTEGAALALTQIKMTTVKILVTVTQEKENE
jgi:hypothetical protein